MFHITLITVGKLKERYYAAAADEYIRRLGAYCKFELIELPECRLPDDPNGTQIAAGLAREAEQIEACLNDIAASANVSPAYLSALFKKNQGISLSDFITSQRISAAARYLTTTTMSLKEISLKCGYANQYYFSTSFKKKMGITPSAYREQHT